MNTKIRNIASFPNNDGKVRKSAHKPTKGTSKLLPFKNTQHNMLGDPLIDFYISGTVLEKHFKTITKDYRGGVLDPVDQFYAELITRSTTGQLPPSPAMVGEDYAALITYAKRRKNSSLSEEEVETLKALGVRYDIEEIQKERKKTSYALNYEIEGMTHKQATEMFDVIKHLSFFKGKSFEDLFKKVEPQEGERLFLASDESWDDLAQKIKDPEDAKKVLRVISQPRIDPRGIDGEGNLTEDLGGVEKAMEVMTRNLTYLKKKE